MTKLLTKEQFRKGFSPSLDGKNCIEPKIQLLPNDMCMINGNKYRIRIDAEDMVELEKVEEF